MDAQTTTATVPPSVSYLQPPHAAAHHDTSLPIEKLQPEDPEKGRSHVSKYKQVAFHAIISFSRRLHCSPSSPKVIHYRLVWCKQSTDPTRRPPRAFPKKLESLDRPTSLQQPKTPFLRPTEVFSQHPHRAPRGSITFSTPPPSPFK